MAPALAAYRRSPASMEPPMPPKPSKSVPAPRLARLRSLAIAGAVATLAADLTGQTLSPLLDDLVPGFGPVFDPRPIGEQALAELSGLDAFRVETLGLGQALHVVLGVVVFPALWLFAARPLLARVAPRFRTFGAAAVYGCALWVAAVWGAAHVVAGNPPFLGWTSLAWVALTVHLVYAFTLAAMTR
ncbi:MAG: hypothetical protein EA355_12770 [Rhodobacteraceae bacterium]|nr:MAG: hypothetical protein EA355_12770 [Paracoccaceae bacterium]